MSAFRQFVKKYKLIPCAVMVIVIAFVAYFVKWYRYINIAGSFGEDAIYFYRYYDVIVLAFIAAAVLIFFLAFVRKSPIHKIYLASCIALGIIFSLIITPNAGADETHHMYHIMGYVNGITGVGDTGKEGTYYARKSYAELELGKEISVENYIKTAKNFWSLSSGEGNDMTEIESEVYDYSPAAVILYMPAIVAILLGRALSLGGVLTYMLARLFMVAVYAVITYYAIKKIPVGKNLLALIMLLPMMISRVACISEDCVLYAVIFLYTAYVFNSVFSDRTIKWQEASVLVCSGLFLAAFKGGIYIPLLLLLFLIPKKNFGTRVKYPVVVAVSIFLAVITFAIVNSNIILDVAASGQGGENELMWIDIEGFTLRRMFTHPKEAACMFFNTVFFMGGNLYSEMVAGGFGWLQIYTSDVLTAAFTILIVLTMLNSEGKEICFNKKQRVISIIAVLICIFIIVMSMWIFWTPVGFPYIVGLQGRYFIPLLFVALYPFKNKRCIIKKNIGNGIIFSCVMFHIITFWEIYMRITI